MAISTTAMGMLTLMIQNLSVMILAFMLCNALIPAPSWISLLFISITNMLQIHLQWIMNSCSDFIEINIVVA